MHISRWGEIKMREEGSVNMVARVTGTVGELGKGMVQRPEDMVREPVSLEILSVGPLFREVDLRRLYWDMKKVPFFKHVPI
jgi:hypothetical protein